MLTLFSRCGLASCTNQNQIVVVLVLVVLLIILQEELRKWHLSGVTRTEILVVGVNFSKV